MKPGLFIFFLAIFSFTLSHSQDSLFVKVQFLYGSKPLKKHKATEKKWFGGILGGHVGIETEENKFYSFEGKGKQHIFSSRKNKNSVYRMIDSTTFWDIMGSNGAEVKRLTLTVPLSSTQKQKLDSINKSYLLETPYDYAVFGMRCGASTYEILAQIGVLPQYSNFKTYMKIFYPRKLRKRLIAKAEKNGWSMLRKEGSKKRKWEKDV